MIHRSARPRNTRGESGAVLIVVALAITALFVIVAIVIDLGATRGDRRNGQLAVDNAASAAGQELGESDAESACETALGHLSLTLDTTFPDDDCDTFAPVCVDTLERLVTVSAGDYVVRLEYPVFSNSALMDKTSTIGASAIALDPDDGLPCDRFGVEVTTTGSSYFGGIAGESERISSAHAVVRGIPFIDPYDIPAFLILERVDCGALVDNNTGYGIQVQNTGGGEEPGIIHVDSNAEGDCSGSTKGHVVYGSPLPSGAPSIVVRSSTTDPVVPGQISVVAPGSKAGAVYPGGLNVDVTRGTRVVSRAPVDLTYNSTSSPAITDMHKAAYEALTTLPGYVTIGCNGSVPATTPPTEKVFVNCPSGYAGSGIAGVTDVVFSHDISLGNADTASFPDAQRVIIRGSLAIGEGDAFFPKIRELYVGAGVSMGNNGKLGVNSPVETSCAAAGVTAAKFVIFGGDPAMSLNNDAAFCATTVYLAGPLSAANSDHVAQQSTNGTPDSSCTTALPCPLDTGNTATGARFAFGGNLIITWTAPNQYPGELPVGVAQGLEDLAFWSEAMGTSRIGNNGEINVTGVMVAPSMRIDVRSPASAVPRNAQFIARKLWLYQGGLNMQPARGNAVGIPSIENFRLIR